jgi:hypothetical protein
MLRALGFVAGLVCAIAGYVTCTAGQGPHASPGSASSAQPDARPAGPGQATTVSAQGLAFDSAKAWEHLQQLVAIGPRPAGSTGMRRTRAYITRQMAAIGLTVQEQTFTATTPKGPVEMVNLIVRLPGRRAEKILFTGHYDTKPFDDITFVGANDGGSSGAFLVELARVLKDRPRDFTWELVWFDGEEAFCLNWDDCSKPGAPDNTYGSRHYVQAAKDAGGLAAIRAMILVDMIAERGAVFPRESRSTAWLKDIIWGAAAKLGHGGTFPTRETGVEDDHYPFLDAGVDAVDIIDLEYYDAGGQLVWHTAGDTVDKLAAQSLQIVGDVLLASLPAIETHLAGGR